MTNIIQKIKAWHLKPDDAKIDYGILFPVIALALFGLAAIYVAVSHDPQVGSPLKPIVMQVIWYFIGALMVLVLIQFDAEQLWKLAPYAYGAGMTLLIAVLFLYSRPYFAQTGAKNWFALGPITFQPSEIMKPAFILMLGKVVAEHNDNFPTHQLKTDLVLLGKLFGWTLPIAILLKLQNDFGTMLVFFAILAGIILVSGISWKIILPAIAVGGTIAVTGVTLAINSWGRPVLMKFGFKQYQFARIDSWLNPSADMSNDSLQLWRSMKAIGSGQLTGKGFNHSDVYVPVRESDMIFSVIGENFGFIGSCVLILLYFLLIYQMIRVIFETKNEFYAYISTGVIMMILFHVFENIGMNIDLLPLTGIPLPFISQGGSSLLGNMIGIGMVMSMKYHYRSYTFSGDGENF